MNDNEERKIAYKKAVSENKLSASTLLRLHQVTQNTLEKWLYVDNRYPSFQACYEIYRLLRQLNYKIPVELARIFNRSNTRIIRCAENLEKKPKSDFEIIGEKKRFNRFVLNSESLSVKEISDKFGISVDTVLLRLKWIVPGSDVSDIDFSIKKRGRKKKENKAA